MYVCVFSLCVLFSILTFLQCVVWCQSSNEPLLHLQLGTDAHTHVPVCVYVCVCVCVCVLNARTCEYLVKDESLLSAEAGTVTLPISLLTCPPPSLPVRLYTSYLSRWL